MDKNQLKFTKIPIGVRVVYRDASLKPVYTKNYTLNEYTDMLKNDLLRLVTDLEDLCYVMSGNKPKDDWSDRLWVGFSNIKHKLLDKANDIGRLPSNLFAQTEQTN